MHFASRLAFGLGFAALKPLNPKLSLVVQGRAENCLLGILVRHLFVVSVGASLDALEPVLDAFRQAVGTGDALFQVVEGSGKGALVNGHARGEPADDALVAVPLVGQILLLRQVDALKVK